jgi:hypothetical protein
MALSFLERQLRKELARLGRGGLAEQAVGRVTLTDDGSTIYVHLFPRRGWPHKHPGQAYVLAWADYEEIKGLAGIRRLMEQAQLSIGDNGADIARWLERR